MGKVGRFGEFGGQYVPETVMNAVHELEEAYDKYGNDPEFLEEYRTLLRDYAGRPSMLYYADRMTKDLGGCKIYLKREDLNHTGAHKINNVLGQILLAKKMGKKRIIAETGAGQHGVATATACAMFDMECEIYMGKEDVRRQRLNVYRMELLGAKVNSVDNGTADNCRFSGSARWRTGSPDPRQWDRKTARPVRSGLHHSFPFPERRGTDRSRLLHFCRSGLPRRWSGARQPL